MRRGDKSAAWADLQPYQLATYLAATGWQSDGLVGKYAEVWHRPAGEDRDDAEVVVPQVASLRDYQQRVRDALESLSDFQARPVDTILDDIIGQKADQISVRVFHHDVAEGTIPLDDGVLLNEKARDLMVASVLSTLSKRRHFTGARPPEAKQYLDSLRLGQTEVGSYIVNVIAPILPVQADQQSIEAVPFARVVTQTLTAGLDALDKAIDRFAAGEPMTVFDDAVGQGASANMCDALKGLSGTQSTRGIEISVAPSGLEPVSSATQTFVFSAERVSVIETAGEYYKENYVLPNRTITGFVKRLDRPHDQEVGTVQIEATLPDGTERNVAVELGPQNYEEAYAAHGAKQVVECSGDLHVNSRSARLLSPAGFRVYRNGELF